MNLKQHKQDSTNCGIYIIQILYLFVCEARSTADRAYQEYFVYYIDYHNNHHVN